MGSTSFLRSFAAALLLLCAAAPEATAGKADVFPGPVQARVIDILDGDTFLAEALIWPGHSVRINIRIRGIDAPEMRSRCQDERIAALRARDALIEIIGRGGIVITNIGGAKYYGRVLADVATEQGDGVARLLIERALVRGYHGGKRASWCAEDVQGR